jgi:endonuclease I
LFTCESGCNSFRGNTPYVDFADFSEALRDACGKRETGSAARIVGFEPEQGKGEVARSTLYFLLRYPGEIDGTGSGVEFGKERLQLLLSWHKSHPPTEYELHRNQAIFAIQGNRNPFIDFPDWAAKVDFHAGFG